VTEKFLAGLEKEFLARGVLTEADIALIHKTEGRA